MGGGMSKIWIYNLTTFVFFIPFVPQLMFAPLHNKEPWPVVTSLCGFLSGIICVCSTTWALPSTLISLTSLLVILIVTGISYLALGKILPLVLVCLDSHLKLHEKNAKKYAANLNSAFVLGVGFALGWCLCVASLELHTPRLLWPFAVYLIFLTFFHWSEFFCAALTHPDRVTVDVYMLNHSPEYVFAALASFFEYCIEAYLWPSKSTSFLIVNLLGIAMCFIGEALRKTAIITAANNFSHTLEILKRKDHELVTTGVYSWFRHPAYVGWFYWSLGTQLILMNPLCAIAYPIVAYDFLSSRVVAEEESLLSFFGNAYCEYQARVGTGLPFIRGYIHVEESL